MPHPFRIRVASNDTGAVDVVAGTFSDDEWKHLSDYLSNAKRLASCRLATTQRDLNFKIAGAKGEQTRIEATLPPEDDIAAFLHYLRPFVLDKSPTNFSRTRSVLHRAIAHDRVRDYLKGLKAIYSGKRIPFEIEIGSRAGKLLLNSEEAIDKWLNGLEYHHDNDKRVAMEAAFGVFTVPAARAMLLFRLLERAAAIGKLGAMIDELSKGAGQATVGG